MTLHAIFGASGVVDGAGFKACLPAATSPVLSLARTDRVELTQQPLAFPGIDLQSIEGPDGHTLRRHVGKSDDEIRARALRTHHDVSTFDDEVTAQSSVDEAFAENQSRIGRWLDAGRGNLALHVHFSHTIGRIFRFDHQRTEPAENADVILERRPAMPQGYTVITAFPS
ncbi:MAG: RNase A-like domain-containing protein [Vulcanimicrobiaceae bacterium]